MTSCEEAGRLMNRIHESLPDAGTQYRGGQQSGGEHDRGGDREGGHAFAQKHEKGAASCEMRLDDHEAQRDAGTGLALVERQQKPADQGAGQETILACSNQQGESHDHCHDDAG